MSYRSVQALIEYNSEFLLLFHIARKVYTDVGGKKEEEDGDVPLNTLKREMAEEIFNNVLWNHP